jgi:hypothetical protein
VGWVFYFILKLLVLIFNLIYLKKAEFGLIKIGKLKKHVVFGV